MPLHPLFRFAFQLVALVIGQSALSATAASLNWVYSVKPGDTLIGIAENYLDKPQDWSKLQALNKIPKPRSLKPGETLRLPVSLLKREAAVAEVIFAQGRVTRRQKVSDAPQPLTVDMPLQMGDVVETGPEASISLRFVDGSRLLLVPDTQVTLAEMILLGKTGIAQTIIELHRGSVDTQVAKQEKPAARYEIKSRTLNLAVRGTDFRVRGSETEQAYLAEVLEGAIQANGSQGKAVSVPAGFGTLALSGQAPRTPQPLPPAPDLKAVPTLLERLPLRFDLPAHADNERFHAQVFADDTFSKLLLDGVFNGQSAKWVDLPDGRYTLRVRKMDQNGLEGLNADHEFVLKARPEPPFVSAPLNGGKSYGTESTLRWSASTSAQSYQVQVSAKSDFSELLADVTGVTATAHTVQLVPGQYFWRIATIAEGNDQGPYSDVQQFTQRTNPASPKMEAPEISDKNMTFRWPAGEPGNQYQLQFAADLAFTAPITDKVLTQNQIQIDKPKAGTYYLRIKTIDAEGFPGPFGPAQKLEIPESKWWMLVFLIPLLAVGL